MKIADGVGGGERVLLNTTKSTQSSRLGATPKRGALKARLRSIATICR